MVTEHPELSMRVKRQLPHSFLGRVFLTWFNPGPGTGYLFAVSNMATASIISLAVVLYFQGDTHFPVPWNPTGPPSIWEEPALLVAIMATSYVAFYLGVGKLLISLLRRRLTVSLVLGIGVQILLLLGGTVIPMILLGPISNWDIDNVVALSQTTNPVWTFAQLDGGSYGPSIVSQVSGRLLMALALVVFALNLPGVVREVRHVRIAAPRRVTEDEAETKANVSV